MPTANILKELIFRLNTNTLQFEKDINVNRGRISKAIDRNSTISVEIIDKIVARFPMVNREWLETGYGKMFKTDTGDELRNRKAFGGKIEDAQYFVPIGGQAGYAKHYHDVLFLQDLEVVYIPDSPFKGKNFRYFQVDGDSMEPTLLDRMVVIAEYVEPSGEPPSYYNSVQNFHMYVIVTVSQILVKRLFKMEDENYLAVISDNEELYPQFKMRCDEIKELWYVRRKMEFDLAPPKNFDITVK